MLTVAIQQMNVRIQLRGPKNDYTDDQRVATMAKGRLHWWPEEYQQSIMS